MEKPNIENCQLKYRWSNAIKDLRNHRSNRLPRYQTAYLSIILAICLTFTPVQGFRPAAVAYGASLETPSSGPSTALTSDASSGPASAPSVTPWAENTDYPLKDNLDFLGMQYCDAVMYYDKQGQPVKERRLRQDGIYGLYNYFGIPDELCRALYGTETEQIGTGEKAADGDSLLVLANVPLHQEQLENETYKAQRNAIALVIRDYMNSFSWQKAGELERAKRAALYIASTCTYDTTLYTRFISGEDTQGDPSFTAYGCLVNHKAVCEGISVACQLLMRATGLKAFCAPDDTDPYHMFVYVEAEGSWYKVDLAVLGVSPQSLVDGCFKTPVNGEVERVISAYLNKENPYNENIDYESLAPGRTFDLTRGGRYRNY